MDPNKIELVSVNKMFEYEKISRDISSCSDLDMLQNICKCYAKLYLKQQETLIQIENTFSN